MTITTAPVDQLAHGHDAKGLHRPPRVLALAPPQSEEDMDLFVVRTRLYQVEDDPAAADEAARLRAYLEHHR